MEQKLFQLLVKDNDISWKSMLLSLVKEEGMDPWDIDVSKLTNSYMQQLKEMKEADLKASGKVVLAAAILLGIKSKRLVGEDLTEFDRLLSSAEDTGDSFYDSLEQEMQGQEHLQLPDEAFRLQPRLPQPRRRKVSIFELVSALEKALEVKKRRENRLQRPAEVDLPENAFDITQALSSLLSRITSYFTKKETLTFSKLVSNMKKEDKVYTFIPLLHLNNDQKVYLKQEKAFGEISILQNEPNE